ncbi:MAG TPA: alpha/beta hydrolase [Candidatus Limnocylindrales bacterium]|nr:alpha/beta hydrolase [Candidatus Limnocylindrales bacterium]
MPYVTAPDGVRLHYDIEGVGPPLILHLGAGADASVWRDAGYVDRLAPSRRCVLFDHRGHGASDHPSSPSANTIDRYAADVNTLIEALDLDRPDFLGWSNGLTVGLRAAAEHPALFRRLVLFGGMARRPAPEQLVASTQARLEGMRAKGWWYLLDEMVAAERSPVPQWFLDRVVATDQGPWFAYTEARPTWDWSPWDVLPTIGNPTLILVGELEDPEDVMGDVANAIPNARRIRIPGKEHILAFLDVEFAAPRILEFLGAPKEEPSAAGRHHPG